MRTGTNDNEERMRPMAGFRGFAMVVAGLVLAACAAPRGADSGGAPETLAGTSWRLTELNGRTPVLVPGGAPTLEFAAGDEGRASGNGGCNQFTGPYTQNGTSLHFGGLASTRRACADPAATSQEAVYLRALQATTRFSVTEDRMVLFANAEPVARLRRSGG
jgi:heat shock protein HslJ